MTPPEPSRVGRGAGAAFSFDQTALNECCERLLHLRPSHRASIFLISGDELQAEAA